MNFWVGLAIAAVLLLLGLLGLIGGGVVVVQQMRQKNAARAARARRLEAAPPATGTTHPPEKARAPAPKPSRAQPVSIHERPTDVRKVSELLPQGAEPPPSGSNPTLLPDIDDADDVPTGVFRPSQYQDIEAMMQEADKYVNTHKKGS